MTTPTPQIDHCYTPRHDTSTFYLVLLQYYAELNHAFCGERKEILNKDLIVNHNSHSH